MVDDTTGFTGADAMRDRARQLASIPPLGEWCEVLRAAGKYVLDGSSFGGTFEGGPDHV